MENRKKVILHNQDGIVEDLKLALTQEQINLLQWLTDEDLLSEKDWAVQVLEDADNWIKV